MDIHLDNITAVHWLLAFGGMMLHLLFKLEKARKKEGFTFGAFVLDNSVSTAISIVTIILCMFICSDEAVASQLPITYATSVFLGWQSRSVFKSVMDMTSKRVSGNNEQNS